MIKTNEELILQKLDSLTEDMSAVKQDLAEVKQDVSVLKQDVSGLKQDVSGLKQDVSGLKQGQEKLIQRVEKLEYEVKENTNMILGKIDEKVDELAIDVATSFEIVESGIKIMIDEKIDELAVNIATSFETIEGNIKSMYDNNYKQITDWTDNELREVQLDMDSVKYLHQYLFCTKSLQHKVQVLASGFYFLY